MFSFLIHLLLIAAFASGPAQAATQNTPATQPSAVASRSVEVPNSQMGTAVHVTDGDTLTVILEGQEGDNARRVRVRILGIQAIEMTTYSDDPQMVAGECMAIPAYERLRELVLGKKVQLSVLAPSAESRSRPVRSVAVLQSDGVWQDVGEVLIAEGLALPMPSKGAYTWNYRYESLAQRAAAQRLGLFNPAACGVLTQADAVLRVDVHPTGNGNREFAQVTNMGTNVVDLSQWYLRDSGYHGPHAHGFTFPRGTTVRPSRSVRVYVGRGRNRMGSYFLGLYRGNVFNEPISAPIYQGDGAYLFDDKGALRAWRMYPEVTTAQTTDTEPGLGVSPR